MRRSFLQKCGLLTLIDLSYVVYSISLLSASGELKSWCGKKVKK